MAASWVCKAGALEKEGTEVWLFRLPVAVGLGDLDGAVINVGKHTKNGDVVGRVLRDGAAGDDYKPAPFSSRDALVLRSDAADSDVRALVRRDAGGARVSHKRVSRVVTVAFEPHAADFGAAELSVSKYPPSMLTDPAHSEQTLIAQDLKGPRFKETSFASTRLTSRKAYAGQKQLENMQIRFRPSGGCRTALGGKPAAVAPEAKKREGASGEKKKKKKKAAEDVSFLCFEIPRVSFDAIPAPRSSLRHGSL
ncbi:hypothetical protein M885DRAFT_168188 [Pelagophyceae sp. CCMP2097]|nr:hypothetical protein M885DRAFT_168188 [Pelagophyceae sp. CCMP2097]